ncbi:HlyD family secretion protein [Dokdonella sp. MW10]|uniref:HlyD family secretion protein n=1 Tax=Dokdonella sp. MW10 TaxID=2992926 RepID=UPI003F7EC412
MTAMRRSVPMFLAVSTLVLGLAACSSSTDGPAATAQAAPASGVSTLAAGGLVEPASEERIIIPQLSGRLSRVLIEEGDTVTAGQLIAEIENAEYRAALAAAAAQVGLREAELARLRNGARREELDEAAATLAAAKAREALARADRERIEPLLARKLASQAQIDAARAQAEAAIAERERAAASLALLRAGARAEDLAAAEAGLEAARAERDRAQALFDKSQIRSPIDGRVLKRDLREGETVVALSPLPLARLGDLARRTVRADIEELDIGRIAVGQRASVASDAFPGQRFEGKVTRVSQRMGRRNQTSGDPAEKQDAKILEALVELDGEPPLPVGLRVDVFIDAPAR